MARELADVLGRVLAAVPEDQRELVSALKATRDSVLFAPPELMRDWWGRATRVLNGWLEENPDLADAEWVARTKRIWAGTE